MRLETLIVALGFAFAAAGCAQAGLRGSGTKDETREKRPVDSDRPSDESEGLLGYLVDPEMITVTMGGAAASVKGSAGAVTDRAGQAAAGPVLIARAKADDVGRATGAQGPALAIVPLATVQARADGSFDAAGVVIGDGDALIVAVGMKGDEVSLAAGRDVGARRAAAVFALPPGYAPFAPLVRRNGGGLGTGTGTGPAPGTVRAVSRVWLSEHGLHVEGPQVTECPDGFRRLTSIADCAGGSCLGVQWLCITEHDAAPTDATRVAIDARITPLGVRSLDAPACDAGYEPIGFAADCTDAVCQGVQSWCVRYASFSTLAAGASYVADLRLTPAAQREAAGVCTEGFELRGTVVDCALTTCSGFQNLCLRFGTK